MTLATQSIKQKAAQAEVSSQKPTEQKVSVSWVTVEEEMAGQRIDNFLITHLKGVPKTLVYRILRKGEVRVNKKRVKALYRIQEGDLIRVPPVRTSEAKAAAPVGKGLAKSIEDAVLYEDPELLIINKPSGLAVHGGSGVNLGLIEALRQLRPQAKFLELVHRLDRDTSGCVMIAKKRSALRKLHEDLRMNRIDKIYQALVVGAWPKRKQQVKAPLRKNELRSGERVVRVAPEGKDSHTQYRVLEVYENLTLVEAKPITGRTHQIRVHCQFAGHPIVGDEKYGEEHVNRELKAAGIRRLFLHAGELRLRSPKTGDPIRVKAPLEDNLVNALKQLAR